MPIIVRLCSNELISLIVHDLCAAGGNPSGATIRALHAHLYERFTSALADRLIKPLKIRPESGPNSGGPATLPALSNTGCEYWYTELHFVTSLDAVIDEIMVIGDDLLQVLPISYGWGIERAVHLTKAHKKRLLGGVLRINHLRVAGALFQSVLDTLVDVSQIQPLLPNFEPVSDIQDFRVVSYDHMLTGARSFCSCARPFHQSLVVNAREIEPDYVPNSWPHEIIALLAAPTYLDGICHLCIARTQGAEESTRRYGGSIAQYFEKFIAQVQFDAHMDRTNARAEIQRILGLSRWVREAELYSVVRDLFKDELILREASPDWLGRMRLDIYLPNLKLAIEHQGEQHYRPIAVFGGEEAYDRVVERDALKRQLCKDNGVDVIDIRFDAAITKPALQQRLQRYLRD